MLGPIPRKLSNRVNRACCKALRPLEMRILRAAMRLTRSSAPPRFQKTLALRWSERPIGGVNARDVCAVCALRARQEAPVVVPEVLLERFIDGKGDSNEKHLTLAAPFMKPKASAKGSPARCRGNHDNFPSGVALGSASPCRCSSVLELCRIHPPPAMAKR